MRTRHALLVGDARRLDGVSDASVHLVVTSPPYPMIAMWDATFRALGVEADPEAEPDAAFAAQHATLDPVWAECARVLVPGGLLCVNVGDAVRTVRGGFRLFPNHARVLDGAARAGFTALPDILWRKPTNAPNKFMGSGMLPGGAYVTYEHEYVLVLRRAGSREWSGADRERRQRSAYFWEERNVWFSDVWSDVRGTGQRLGGEARARSGAFPVEVPWRLVHMYSALGDVVLDPFAGTGTTLVAAAVAGRSSVGVELDPAVAGALDLAAGVAAEGGRPRARAEAHAAFVARRLGEGKTLGHHAPAVGLPVVTRQEAALELWAPRGVEPVGERAWEVSLDRLPPWTDATSGRSAPR